MTAPAMEDYEFDRDFFEPEQDEIGAEQVEPELGEPDADFIEEPKETPRARKYRVKTKNGLNYLFRMLAGNPKTVPDAAAIVVHGPDVCKAVGQLCDKDDRARAFVDFITDDAIENPYLITALTVLPLVFQVMRNHEPSLDQVKVGKTKIRIPFTKRAVFLPFTLRLRLFRGAREMTEEPQTLTAHVFGNPAVREALAKHDIRVAWPSPNGRAA